MLYGHLLLNVKQTDRFIRQNRNISHKFISVFFLLIILPGAGSLFAQQSSVIEKTIELQQPDTTLFLDFLVDRESVEVLHNDTLLDSEYWNFEPNSGNLELSLLDELFAISALITVRYNEPPIRLEPLIRLREFREVEEEVDEVTEETESILRATSPREELFGDADIVQSGSLTRGFTVGNRQDLSLDSGLRLDLTGNITDNVSILATLTDRSTPIQPDGSTQNIREFDRVYIQLQAPIGELELGDVDLVLDESDFARINRRVQGAVGRADTPVGEFGSGISVSRGQFRSQQFNGIEGVQGPYRLTGAENEAFIIVLAGSETVYIDGQQVNRGTENEYVIDYSLGEITFTNNLVVTDETRIIVEFQYITQTFTRTLFTAKGSEDNLLNGRMNFGATYIREADDKNPATQLNLTESDIDRLRELGDDVDDFFISGADSVGFQENPGFILYVRKDTTVNGDTFEIFENIPGDPRGVYRVRFTNFGEGNGSYRRVGGTVNGILYEWVGPGEGSYEPLVRLQAPQSHQMVALNSGINLSSNLRLNGEWAVSDLDRNRFSEVGGQNTTGQAANGELQLHNLDTAIGQISASIRQRYIGENFEFFDRPREIEFDRRWNLVTDEASEEWQTDAQLELQTLENSNITLSGGMLSRSHFDGRRAEAVVGLHEERLPQLYSKTEWVSSEDDLSGQNGTWFRNRGEVNRSFTVSERSITPFLNWETEKRTQKSVADSLLPNSLQFYDLNPGLRYQTENFTIEGGIGYRENQRPMDNRLQRESVSRSQRFGLIYQPTINFRTENRLQFRQKRFEEDFEDAADSPRSRGVLMRSLNNYNVRDYVDGELLYEANTERRALLQETYIEVGPELGQYVWIDLNNDGVQQLDEFFPEVNPNEGTFIRQFIPSDELFPVIDLNLRSRNEIRIGELYTRFSNQEAGSIENLVLNSLIDIHETSTEEDLKRVYLLDPAVFRSEDTTITGQLIIRQRLSWHTPDRTFESSLNWASAKSLFQRASGFESRTNRTISTDNEYRLTEGIRLKANVNLLKNLAENSRFPSRNVDITGYEIEPGVRIFISRSAQTEFNIGYSNKENRTVTDPAEAVSVRLENFSQLYLFNRFQNMIRLQVRNTRVTGDPGGQAEFELTDGVGSGTNLLWNLNSSYRASSLVRLSLQYNGRTTSTRQVIQTMRFVVSAVF